MLGAMKLGVLTVGGVSEEHLIAKPGASPRLHRDDQGEVRAVFRGEGSDLHDS